MRRFTYGQMMELVCAVDENIMVNHLDIAHMTPRELVDTKLVTDVTAAMAVIGIAVMKPDYVPYRIVFEKYAWPGSLWQDCHGTYVLLYHRNCSDRWGYFKKHVIQSTSTKMPKYKLNKNL